MVYSREWEDDVMCISKVVVRILLCSCDPGVVKGLRAIFIDEGVH